MTFATVYAVELCKRRQLKDLWNTKVRTDVCFKYGCLTVYAGQLSIQKQDCNQLPCVVRSLINSGDYVSSWYLVIMIILKDWVRSILEDLKCYLNSGVHILESVIAFISWSHECILLDTELYIVYVSHYWDEIQGKDAWIWLI